MTRLPRDRGSMTPLSAVVGFVVLVALLTAIAMCTVVVAALVGVL
jgi:hypothetical protein